MFQESDSRAIYISCFGVNFKCIKETEPYSITRPLASEGKADLDAGRRGMFPLKNE